MTRAQCRRKQLDAPLRAARKQAGVTLIELVELLRKAGISTTAGWISRIERGGDCMCSPSLAQAIAKVLVQRQVPLTEIQIIYPERYKNTVQDRRPTAAVD